MPVSAPAWDSTARDLRGALAAGELNARELVHACLERIGAVDPAIRSVLSVADDALEQAAASDRRRAAGRAGPLEGVPVLIKDNVAVTGLPTTAGSRALADARPPDARIVRRLRAAGAVILGKTNMSEWGNVRSPRSTSGWSATGGQTRNPHDLDRTPSGSSSGSAAAVAAGLAPLAVGTESDGSIISPAGTCGVVGLKPTVGVIPCSGVVPVWSGQDVIGPMTRTVADAALLYAVLAGATVPAAAGPLAGARIGVWYPEDVPAAARGVLADAVAALRAAGATVVSVHLAVERLPPKQDDGLLARFRLDLDEYLAAVPGSAVRSLAALVEFNRQDAVELSRFGQENFERALALPRPDPAAVALHQAMRTAAARSLVDGVLGEHRLDAIVTLSNGPAPAIDYGTGDGPEILTTTAAAVAGYPMVTVPAGFVDELPAGVTLIGTGGSDARLLGLAGAFERVTGARRPPRSAVPA